MVRIGFFKLNIFICVLAICIDTLYITPRRFRNLTLFIVDLVFYAWGEPWLVILMLFSILLNYTSGILIGINREKKGFSKIYFYTICNIESRVTWFL